MKAYIGIFLVMGVDRLKNVKYYWSTRPGLINPLISRTMSRNRFKALQANITCCSDEDNPQDTPDQRQHAYMHMLRNPLYPVQRLWESIQRRCLRHFRPKRNRPWTRQ